MAEKKRGGGPKTAEGKARSSQNARRHGVRARCAWLLPDETQEEFDAVEAGWREQFTPADYQEEKLVAMLVLNDWLHRRAERWQVATEMAIVVASGPNPLDWTSEQRQRMELAQRYKNTAERTFQRSWTVLRTLREDNAREELAEAKRKRMGEGEEYCEPPRFIVVVEDGKHAQRQDPEKPDSGTMSRSEFEAWEKAEPERVRGPG